MHTIAVMFGKRAGRIVALAGVVGILAMSAPAAWGAPADSGTAADTLTVGLTDVGSTPTLDFWGVDSTHRLTVPVPPGLVPDALNAVVQLPLNMRSGIITVTQDERPIARLNLPATDQAPIVIPLAGAEVNGNSVTVTMRTTLMPLEGNCLYPWSPLRLVDGTISYTGVEQPPTTVAHFLPPVLRKLTIFVPQSPSVAESDTAVQLATSAAAHYGRQNPEIAVVPLPEGQLAPPTPPRQLERQIVIKEGPDDGLAVQSTAGEPWLLISGPLGKTNESDIALLFGGIAPLAFTSKVTVGSLTPEVRFPGNSTTLRELGLPFASASALQPRVSIGLDQTRFGRSVHSVRVHLQGSYSPTPANIGGQIEAMIGTETIDHWPTDAHGVIDRWVDVPDRLLQRYTSLDVVLDVAGNIGHCGDFYTAGAGNQLLKLTIDGDTIVQTSPAAPPVPDGLRSVPQALMPQVQVGIEPRSLDDTVRAVEIMVILQRLSAIPIATVVTSAQKAIDSPNPAIVIAAGGWNHRDIVLPVSAGPSGPITVNASGSDGKPTTLTLDPTLRFASVQTVFNRGRTLLIATSNGAPPQLDELLRWLTGDDKRWPKLQGVAVVSVPGQDPVTIDHTNTWSSAATSQSHSDLGWLWWLAGGWLAVAVVGAGVIVLRSRRGSRR